MKKLHNGSRCPGSLTSLDLRFEFDPSQPVKPWSVGSDVTGGEWAIVYQNWGVLIVEEVGTGCEHYLTIQYCHQTRERVEIRVTLADSYTMTTMSETVRVGEIGLATSRMACQLLETAK
jgi:hypothetical protein